MKGQLSAKKLRIILLISIVLVLAAVCGGFWFAYQNLSGYAKTISQLNANANSGDQSIATLKTVEARLEAEKETIASAKSVIADNATFADRIVGDVTRLAAESGVSITSFEYVDSPSASTGAASASTPAATAPVTPGAASPTPAASGSAGLPAGVTQKSISVNIASPVNYTKLMTFIQKIESNVPKLQIANVKLTREDNGNVGTGSFSIGAYVR